MIKMLELRELIKLVNRSSIEELDLTNRGVRITMKKNTSPLVVEDQQENIQLQESNSTPVSADAVDEVKLHSIVSPFIGLFSSSIPSKSTSLLKVGDKITVDQVVCSCHVEALGLCHEIKSDVNGEIVEALVKDRELVVYGQPLFLVKPE